jgi:hypothetical protein
VSRTRYADTLFRMLTRHRKALALAGLVTMVGVWYLWLRNDIPQLVAEPISVSYDEDATRLTAIVNIQNRGDRSLVASITNDVFVNSQKQLLNDPGPPSRIEFGSKQVSPVSFNLEGETAAAVWNGVRLMEVTIDAAYDGDAKRKCHFSFMGRFYPQLKQIGTVSSVTSPRACGVR